jgi:ABC-2 type transport system permease protein
MILIISIVSSMLIKSGSSAGYGLLEGFKAYSVSIIPMFSLVALAAFFSQFFRSGSGALTTCVFLYFLFRGAIFILPRLSKILPFSNTNWYSLWLGGSVSSTSILLILSSIISYCLIFFSAGFYFFDKRDI